MYSFTKHVTSQNNTSRSEDWSNIWIHFLIPKKTTTKTCKYHI